MISRETGAPNFSIDCSKTIVCADSARCVPKDCPLSLPTEPIRGLGKSFSEIGAELAALKEQLLALPITRAFLASPYTQTQASVEQLDRTWALLNSRLCNENVPTGYGKRVLMCTNGGHVFLNVQTYDSSISALSQSYYVVIVSPQVNFIYTAQPPATTPVTTININPPPYSFNPDNIDISKVVSDPSTQVLSVLTPSTLLCGCPQPPPTTAEPAAYQATSFELLENHLTRKEVQQAIAKVNGCAYGYASRYSDTNFLVNYYVATTITGSDGYEVCLRLSYFAL